MRTRLEPPEQCQVRFILDFSPLAGQQFFFCELIFLCSYSFPFFFGYCSCSFFLREIILHKYSVEGSVAEGFSGGGGHTPLTIRRVQIGWHWSLGRHDYWTLKLLLQCSFKNEAVLRSFKSIGNPLRRVPVCFGTHDGHCDGFRCDVYIRKELRATVELSGDYDIGVKIEGSFKGWVIELFQLNRRSTSYKCGCDFGVPGDCSPGTEAGHADFTCSLVPPYLLCGM